MPRAADIPAAAFGAVDAAEFQRNEYGHAVTLLRPMAASGLPAVRAESLLRIARNQRKAGQWHQSIETYRELARLGDVPIGDTNGAPAELVARAAICDVLAEQAPGDRLATEARALDLDLQRGKWRVLRPAYERLPGKRTTVARHHGGSGLDGGRIASGDSSCFLRLRVRSGLIGAPPRPALAGARAGLPGRQCSSSNARLRRRRLSSRRDPPWSNRH